MASELKIERRPLGEQVTSLVRRMIQEGELTPGVRLVEEHLAAVIGTSRTPIREALHRLEQEKLVMRRKQGGYQVRPLSAREVEETAGVRAVLESYQCKGPFPAWRPGFLEAYVREGTRTRPDGRVELCCHPDWEARCFAVCPHDVWALPPLLKRPCLVIYGENSDTFLPPAVRRLARDVPGALIRPLAGASHFAPMERP